MYVLMNVMGNTGGFCKKELMAALEGKPVTTTVAAKAEVDGVELLGVGYKEAENFVRIFISTLIWYH